MRIGKACIGRMAEVAWRDPFRMGITSTKRDFSDVEVSEAVFPLQRERGVIIIIREGIVVISHTQTTDSPLEDSPTLANDCTFVPEDRIESITLFVAEPAPPAKESNGKQHHALEGGVDA
jgi:hypothetical protein